MPSYWCEGSCYGVVVFSVCWWCLDDGGDAWMMVVVLGMMVVVPGMMVVVPEVSVGLASPPAGQGPCT